VETSGSRWKAPHHEIHPQQSPVGCPCPPMSKSPAPHYSLRLTWPSCAVRAVMEQKLAVKLNELDSTLAHLAAAEFDGVSLLLHGVAQLELPQHTLAITYFL
jgi:hypothetical protein